MQVIQKEVGPNKAQLTIYLQTQSKELSTAAIRPAVLIFPGGGYFVCSDREAEPVALAYLAEGFNAFVLRYTVGEKERFQDAFEDAEAALRELRAHAAEWHIDAAKIAVAGFSAGGHLAACLGTAEGERPNALILGYPVIKAEMGPPVNKELWAADERVTEDTPPTFLFSTSDDNVVPVENSLAFAAALARHNVYFELHVYLTGEHGVSLAKAATANGQAAMVNPPVAEWFSQSVRFLQQLWGDFPLKQAPPPAPVRDRAALPLDTPIKRLLQDKQSRAVLTQCLPGVLDRILANPMAHGLSLNQMAEFAGLLLPPEVLDHVRQELDKLKK